MPTDKPRAGSLAVLLTVLVVSPPPGAAQSGTRQTILLEPLGDPVRLEQQLRALPADAELTVPGGEARRGDVRIAPGETVGGNLLVVHGTAEVSGRIRGNLVVLDGDIVLRPGGVITGDALALGGAIRERGGGVIQGERRSLGAGVVAERVKPGGLAGVLSRAAGLAGMLVTLTLIGFGLVIFAQPQLETMSDTVAHSLMRSFLAGLLGQVVVLPTLGMLVTGLVLSVVGIILVPFVLVVVPLALLAAVVSGLLAVAHAMGETRVRRRAAAGARIGSANSYRYLLLGMSAVAWIWVGWVLFGWVPLAGALMLGGALLASWFLATVGFGATLLSRGGTRPAFAGRMLPPEAMTDEYLWATPRFGVDAVKRPAKREPGSRGAREPES